MSYKNYTEKLRLLKEGKLSLVENVQNFLSRIEERKNLNAFTFLFAEEAIQKATEVELKIAVGSFGKLAGMVIAVKDVLAIKDKPLTCSSRILENFTSLYTATAVQKLLDEDAIIIGKTNCDEFAMGSSNENSAFGAVKNPLDETRVPGGSSGGSAVAVAANLCDVALGTDTGGSIRQPAAFCGIYGLKPTYGLVSRFGLTAFASSFDCIGPFANSVEDIALTLEVLAGQDKSDSTSINAEKKVYPNLLGNNKQKLKIGIPKEYFVEGLSLEIKEQIELVIHKLKELNFSIEEVSLPHTEFAIATYYILTTAEASSNLARFDGARYGYRSKQSSSLKEMYNASRSEGFGSEVKRRIMLGTYVLSSGYYDAYYKKAQKVRRKIKEDFVKVFSKIDVLLTPTTPTTAFKLGEKTSDPLEMYLSDIFTTSANLAGIPGINIPIGKDKNNLPIGLQLLANQFEEEKLLQLGSTITGEILII
ncbi:MAG: Asp-tRNA(Asn)/Glu-tRNA(Gln) amidotransferase GatCAB subunit A [Ignavibacteria bacterium CG_4_8_14_3_um_filter_37_9]|nr:MAG: aspartyl/glutamyl-tRNA amidotransferase subunit A [Ignavibacteria bacterium CG1_02_37_35]PIS45270.1 MAG: Asp-tRNA(Asn)/Glu-tRNA(Gln) amidotransferase GatCAB subunit A [Ignavibacteria bacterium CG08_land_8_20_14_0_20_37_9]PIX00144.1 MAG: Asp-tRNA(Asn)/Glu-tRNA(Gln) amidotransferase GatCAB subunit A [Ignavibacteria bacterium CG_4_8_14_3_um_filter_37_9]PIX94518.1 MAG: Asp-tRNA(Asn)/Glu-tRNA(Gln) amidotransferase GatCAB subunit A [Ignavibacteria bacterium CG_4_10_14_3_um_filter_37_18]